MPRAGARVCCRAGCFSAPAGFAVVPCGCLICVGCRDASRWADNFAWAKEALPDPIESQQWGIEAVSTASDTCSACDGLALAIVRSEDTLQALSRIGGGAERIRAQCVGSVLYPTDGHRLDDPQVFDGLFLAAPSPKRQRLDAARDPEECVRECDGRADSAAQRL